MRSQPLRAEVIKLRRAPVWIAYVTLPVLAAVIGTFNYRQNLGLLTPGWENLWTQHTLFELCFFLPALVGVGSSWLMKLEHADTNWNGVLTSPVAPWRIVASKLVVGTGLLATSLLATGLLFVLCGSLVGLEGFPPLDYAGYLLFSLMGGVSVVAVQLLLSALVRNFAAPVGVALAGGVSGLLVTARGWGLYWPYALMQVASNTNGIGGLEPAELVTCGAMSCLFTALAVLVCSHVVARSAAGGK